MVARMGKVLAGLFAGLALGVGGPLVLERISPPPEVPCDDRCGEGTECVGGQCRVAVDDTADEAAEPKGKKKRRRKRKRRSRAGAAGPGPEGSESELEPFKPMKDSHIPKYSKAKTVVLDMQGGSERLPDHVVREHMGRVERLFNRCLRTAATYSDEDIGGGEIDFTFSISGKGKVTSVTARAPKNLQVFGIIPCVRVAVYRHRFPSFDGPPMGVDYSFTAG